MFLTFIRLTLLLHALHLQSTFLSFLILYIVYHLPLADTHTPLALSSYILLHYFIPFEYCHRGYFHLLASISLWIDVWSIAVPLETLSNVFVRQLHVHRIDISSANRNLELEGPFALRPPSKARHLPRLMASCPFFRPRTTEKPFSGSPHAFQALDSGA